MSGYELFRVTNPERFAADAGNKRYPFQAMQVGDAFRLSNDDNAESVRVSAFRYGQRNGCKIVIRAVDGNPCCIRIA